MMPAPSGMKCILAPGYTDMRKGMDSGDLVQGVLKTDPFLRYLFASGAARRT